MRGDIQALRAAAVALVVANHLWPTRLTGGFVGVDVFFVISGFLITAHLLGEIARSDTVSLPKFYARRARRLLPAALLVGLVTLVATLVWIPPERWARIAREIFASAAYFENWMLTASAVNYSDRGQVATPAQHYWSLSVEEQFYLLWPLTLLCLGWLLARKFSGRIATRRSHLALAILVLAAASLAFSLWQTSTNPAASYFNTFGRAWEFLVGALVATLTPALGVWLARARTLALRGVLQLVGYAMILFSAATFSEATLFPGPWAIVPVVGTALVIALGPEIPRWSPARVADWRPVTYLGDISYSLYLWHWPVIVIMPLALARDVGTLDKLVMLALSLVLAMLAKRFVEDPGRTKLFAGARPRRTLVATLASVVSVALMAGGVTYAASAIAAREAARIDAAVGSGCFAAEALTPGNNCDEPFGPALFPAGAESDAPWNTVAQECSLVSEERQIQAEGEPSFVECSFPSATSDSADRPYTVWLVGDSHSEHWRAAVFDLGRGNGWNVRSTMQGGCPTVPTPLVTAFGEQTDLAKQESCMSWINEVSERILADQPDLVLVSNFASTEGVDDGSGRSQPEQLADGMSATLQAWADAGSDVVVIRDVPTAGTSLGASCAVQNGDKALACTAPQTEVLPADPQVAAVDLLDTPRLHTVDLTEYFCVDGTCSGIIGGLPVYYDMDHLSASYSRSLAPALGEKLEAVLNTRIRAPLPVSE